MRERKLSDQVTATSCSTEAPGDEPGVFCIQGLTHAVIGHTVYDMRNFNMLTNPYAWAAVAWVLTFVFLAL